VGRGPYRPKPISINRQHRSGVRPRTGHGLRGVAGTIQRDLTFRFVSNVDATDLVEAFATLGGGDALHHLVQDLGTLETSPTPHVARGGSSNDSVMSRRREALRGGVHNKEKVAAFGIDTDNMFISGTGSASLFDGERPSGFHDAPIGRISTESSSRRFTDRRTLPRRALRENFRCYWMLAV